jgi:hypothetical protein
VSLASWREASTCTGGQAKTGLSKVLILSSVTFLCLSPADFTPYRMKVRKSCVPSCFETVYDGYSKHASATSCCQYYLCNGAGFATPVTLALVPALLATFWSLL